MAKNIVVCSDGTGNKGGYGADSNVFKLYHAVKINACPLDGGVEQVLFYDNGVGTQANKIIRGISGAFGWGFEKNVRDGYEFIARHYREGDRIFLFGFSRGAATVRSMAGLIQTCGLVKHDTPKFHDRVDEALEVYRTNVPGKCSPKIDCFLSQGKKDQFLWQNDQGDHGIPIHFLGIWDTVSALGFPQDGSVGLAALFAGLDWLTEHFYIPPGKLPFLKKGLSLRHRYHEYQADKVVERVYHALAIDEARTTFHPKIWREQGRTLRPDSQSNTSQEPEQVWFAGVHSNVGGGYPRAGMSDMALHWMMAWAARHGLIFNEGAVDEVCGRANVHDKIYNSRDGLAIYYRYGARHLEELCYASDEVGKKGKIAPGQIKIHQSVWDRLEQSTAAYAPGHLPRAFLEVATPPPDPAVPVTPPQPRQAKYADQWSTQVESLTKVENKRQKLYLWFTEISMILLLLAWTFWQNPSENYGQMVAYPSMWNHVTEVLSYYLPGFFGPLLHFVMVVKPLGIAGILVIYFIMFKWRKCLLRQSRGASQEIRKLVLAGSTEMANPPPGAGQTWCQKPQFLGNPSWWGWLFLLVSLFMVGMNGLFALTIRDGQVFSKTGKTIFKNQESGQALSDCGMTTTPVEVQSTKYWNRSKVHLVAGGKYRIVTADPQQTWFDANKEATAMGWNTWCKRSNTHVRLISRLWARAPDYPLYRLMGMVKGPCQYGRRCPIQFPIPWPQGAERSAEFVAPASGELLLYANDLPFMYWNNGQHPEQTTIRFTIQKMNCGAIANPHWQ